MKKTILAFSFLMLWASPLMAQDTPADKTDEAQPSGAETVFDGRLDLGWHGIQQTGNTKAAEYEYLKSSPSGRLDLEWDPLPHRFVLESYYLNQKDYFAEMDYSFKDVVVLNGFTRGLFHNLDHLSFGADDLTTASPSFTDLNPFDQYGTENELRRGFLRLKAPDFPLHLYADVRTLDREGLVQQRFLSSGGLNKVSESRDIDWNTIEYLVGVNSHLGPIEADYSHTEKKFQVIGDRALFDSSGAEHNMVPDFKGSSDTVKAHTSYSGKIVISGTYTSGDRKNEESGASADYKNAAGDVMIMPVTSLIFTAKYRHYDLDVTNPDTITVTGTPGTLNVRDSISSTRDVLSSMLRYRVTDRLTLRGEYINDTTERNRGVPGTLLTPPPADAHAFWDVPHSTTKNTGKIGLAYRIMYKLLFRADYSMTHIDNPAYDTDPDRAHNARAALTWTPSPVFSTMLSWAIVREQRDNLAAPLFGGSRDAARDQGLASATMMIGPRASLTASYGLYRNKVEQTLSLTGDGITIPFALEPGVPYEDVSHVGSLALTVAPVDRVNLIGSVTRSYSRGKFRMSGADGITDTEGIAELSDMKVVDSVYAAGVEMELARYASSEIRYQYRRYDDKVDNTQDGTMKSVLASLSFKW